MGSPQNSPFTVQPSLTSNTTTLSTLPSYSTNLGEIGYLYNTYGTTLLPGGQTYSTDGAALQLALWALEYNQMPTSGAMTLADPNSPFQVNTSDTDTAIITAANNYLSDAYGNSEDAYFLNLNTDPELILARITARASFPPTC